MGFRRTYHKPQRTILTEFKALREVGPRLWPSPKPGCEELPALPEELKRLPVEIEKAVRNAVIRAFREAPAVVTRPSPAHAPPLRSRPINFSVPVVLGGAGFSAPEDAKTNTIAQNLQIALDGWQGSGTIASALLLPGTGQLGQNSLLQITAPPLNRVHVSGIEIVPSSLDAYDMVQATLRVRGETVVDHVAIDALEDISVDAGPGKKLSLAFSNLDPLSVFVLRVRFKGWQYPVGDVGDHYSDLELEDGHFFNLEEPCVPCGDENGACG